MKIVLVVFSNAFSELLSNEHFFRKFWNYDMKFINNYITYKQNITTITIKNNKHRNFLHQCCHFGTHCDFLSQKQMQIVGIWYHFNKMCAAAATTTNSNNKQQTRNGVFYCILARTDLYTHIHVQQLCGCVCACAQLLALHMYERSECV